MFIPELQAELKELVLQFYNSRTKIYKTYVEKLAKYKKDTQFKYNGEICTIIDVFLDEMTDDFPDMLVDLITNNIPINYEIIYLIDIPSWQIKDQPHLKVSWSEKVLDRLFENI